MDDSSTIKVGDVLVPLSSYMPSHPVPYFCKVIRTDCDVSPNPGSVALLPLSRIYRVYRTPDGLRKLTEDEEAELTLLLLAGHEFGINSPTKLQVQKC